MRMRDIYLNREIIVLMKKFFRLHEREKISQGGKETMYNMYKPSFIHINYYFSITSIFKRCVVQRNYCSLLTGRSLFIFYSIIISFWQKFYNVIQILLIKYY